MLKTVCPLLAAVCLLGAEARAAVTGLQVTPRWPALGSQFVVSVIDDGAGPPVVAAQWYYFLTYPPCVSDLYSMTGSQTSTTMLAGTPGYYTIGVYVAYAPMSNLGPQLFTITVGVPPANGLRRIGQDAVPTNIWAATLVQWIIMCGAGPAGPMIAGVCEEDLTNRIDWTGFNSGDTGWVAGAPSPNFQMNRGMIFDWWSLGFVAGWGSIGNRGTVSSCDQQLRIVWSMVCVDHSIVQIINPLPTVHVVVQRVDSMNYSVSASPN